LNNTGAVVIAAGSALTDGQILGMNFLVQGVQGSLPK
jgi:simple sugar transport system substrate-binding protein